MHWIENFNSPNGVYDAAPKVWQNDDKIIDLYTVSNVHEGETGQTCVVSQSEASWTSFLVKSPHPEQFETPEQKEKFIREAEVALRLGVQPHIVSCHYILSLGGMPRIFFEYAGNETLQDWIHDGRLYDVDPEQDDEALWRILRVALHSAWGLHYAYLHGVVHQEVKPENLLMDDFGKVKVANFGRASVNLSAPPIRSATTELSDERADEQVNLDRRNLSHCSPEQARGDRVSHRTDIWSWATTVLEMFTGAVSWESGALAGEALAHYLSNEPTANVIPRMPEEVASLLQQCLQEDPARRPDSLLTVADKLADYCQRFDDPVPGRFTILKEPGSNILNNRALSYFHLGRTENAIATWNESLRLNATHQETVFNRGLVLWRRGEIDDEELLARLREVERAAELDDHDSWGYRYNQYLLMLAHFEQGDWDSARVDDPDVQTYDDRSQRVDGLIGHWARFENQANRHYRPKAMGEHSGGVRSLCFTADGKWALSGGNDQLVRLWDVSYSRWLLKGEPIRTFAGHTGDVRAVCLSKDGSYGASGSTDQTVKLWSLGKAEALRTCEGHTDAVTGVCFDSQGKHLFSSSSYNDRTVRMWEIATGECLRVFSGHVGPVNDLSLDGADKYLATCGGFEDSTVRLWDVGTGECVRIFSGHTDIVQSVRITLDGRFVLSGGSDRTLRLWDVATGECLRTLLSHRASVFSVALTPDGRHAVSGSSDGRLKVWDLLSGQCLRTFVERDHPIGAVAINADATAALSGAHGGDNKINLCSTNLDYRWYAPLLPSKAEESEQVIDSEQRFNEKMEAAWKAFEAKDITTAARNADDLRYADGYTRHPERLKLLRSLYPWCDKGYFQDAVLRYTFEDHARETETVGGAESVHIGPYDRVLSRGRMTLKHWDLETGRVRYERKEHSYLTAADLSPDGEFCVFAHSSPLSVKMLRLSDDMIMRGFYGFDESVTALSFNFYQDRLLTNGNGATFKIWNSHRKDVLHECVGHTGTVTSLCLSSDVKLALSGGTDNTARIWDVETGKCLAILHEHVAGVTAVRLSRDGRTALSGGNDGDIILWDVSTGSYMRRMAAHTGPISDLQFTGDGQFAASASLDGTVKLWQLRDGFCLRTFDEQTDVATSVAFSRNDDCLVTGNGDGTIKVWQLSWWQLSAREDSNSEGVR